MANPLLESVRRDVEAFLSEGMTELFFNERDFRMHLAVYLRDLGKYDDVDVEYYVPRKLLDGYIWESELRLDLVVSKAGEFVPVELKYKTRRVDRQMPRFGERLAEQITVLKDQSAQDLGMYDFWKDVRRVELVTHRFDSVRGGLAVFLTNDEAYKRAPRATSNNSRLRMQEGEHSPDKSWLDETKPATKGRPSFRLDRSYTIRWQEEREAKKRDNESYARQIKGTSSTSLKATLRKSKVDRAAAHDRRIASLRVEIERNQALARSAKK